jgi:hypothetical protein
MEERKAKIAREKRVSCIVKARSVRRHIGEIRRVVTELKQESRLRSAHINEMKEKEVKEN